MVRVRATLCFVLLAFASSCTQCAPTKQEPAVPPKPSAFELGLSVNDASGPKLYAGWPVVLRLNGAWMRDDGDEVTLESKDLELTVLSAAEAVQHWSLQREEMPESKTWGPNNGVLQVLWTVDSEAASAIAVGRYSIRARWAGVESDPLELEFVSPPSSLSLEERLEFAELASQVALVRGDAAQASSITANALQESPNDSRSLARRALAYEAQGEYRLALDTVRQALRAEGPTPEGSEPSFLFYIEARIKSRLNADGGR